MGATIITRTAINISVNDATAKAKNERQHDRIAHACKWINKFHCGTWTLNTTLINVRSETSDRMYTLDIETGCCSCPASNKTGCWHQALSYILRMAIAHQSDLAQWKASDAKHGRPQDALIGPA